MWCGGFICIVLAGAALAGIASSYGWPESGGSLPAFAAGSQLPEIPQLSDRADCREIGRSDLRSPAEGLWFESNCVVLPEPPLVANVTNCNRTWLDPMEFAQVSPGLYVSRQTPSSPAYLWYASSETCFDLVSGRIVAAVCADQTVSFSWNKNVCSDHGGVLAWVNGR